MSPHKRSAWPTHRHYPRMARVNEVLREVLAEEIELVAGTDSRLELVTVTAVNCDPDLRHATVLLASLPDPARAARRSPHPLTGGRGPSGEAEADTPAHFRGRPRCRPW